MFRGPTGWEDALIERQPQRLLARSYTRPLRLAILLRRPVTTYGLKQAIRALGATWGGTRSLLITGTEVTLIDDQWVPALRAFDPDVLLVARPLGGAVRRRLIEAKLERLELAPFWVTERTDPIRLAPSWAPQTLTGLGDDASDEAVDGVTSAESLRNPNPVELAVLGLETGTPGSKLPGRLSRKQRYQYSHPLSLRRGTPLSRAARDVPGFRTQPAPIAPFLFHNRDDKDAALWLWNLRAMRGAIYHGGESALLDYLRVLAASRGGRSTPRQVICLDLWPPSADALVAAYKPRLARPVDPSRFAWRPLLRPSLGGFDLELDELSVVDGELQLARRAARTAGPGGRTELIQGNGAYAIEVDLEPIGASGLRVSLVPTRSLKNSLLATPQSAVATPLTRLGVQSRVRVRGDSTLAILPVRWPRSISLVIPSMAKVLGAAGTGHRFELSDKGHYGRWLVGKTQGLAGLHELLMNNQSRAILSAFRTHHLPGKTGTGAYRRFLTFTEMTEHLRNERRAGRLPRRARGVSDEDWLRQWISSQVSVGVLRAGLWTRCRECLAGSFLSLGSFSETFICPRCGALAQTPAVPKIGYQLAEVVHLFFQNDCDITALAASALARRSMGGYSFDFDHTVIGPKGQQNELDFFTVIDGWLFVGESKKNGEFDQNDMDVLKRVARATRARGVILATGTSCDGGCTENCERNITGRFDSSDTALPTGAPASGPRERALALRAALAPRCSVIVLCRGDLEGSFRVRPSTGIARSYA